VPDRPLEGKVALITGAGSGIGAATARLMSAQGARIAVAGIPAEGVHRVAAEITAAGGQAIGIPTDVSDSAQVKNAVDKTVERFGRLDIIVPNAGIQIHRQDLRVHEIDEAVWDRTHAVNYRGAFLTCKHGLAQMMKQGDGGVVVMVVSVTALLGLSPNVSYSSGKAGLLGLNRNIAVEYAQHGIRCNAVCPGALELTPNHDQFPDPAARARKAEARVPMGRMAQPDDIAPVIAFLAGPGARYMNGANVVVDGGLTVV
jgi:NAD(P)-dependent dehydrogenase (short-subunit alcohol dehydrogenase family)